MNVHNPGRWRDVIAPDFDRMLRREEFASEDDFFDYYDQRMANDLAKARLLRLSITCPVKVWVEEEEMRPDGTVGMVKKQVPFHQETEINFSCRHCREQDPVNPVGIIRFPAGAFFCMDCYRLMQSCRFDYAKDQVVECGPCIGDFLKKLIQEHPDKYHERRKKKR